MTIEIGGGITFGGAISISPSIPTTFTISPSDFTNAYNGGGVTANTPTGFDNNGTQGPGYNFYGPNLGALLGAPSPDKLNELIAYWAANGLVNDGSASYIFNVTWDSSSSPQSDKVVLTLYPDPNYGTLDIGTVVNTNSNWQTGGQDIYNSGGNPAGLLSAQGTYNFPATFTLYQPTIQNSSNWC